MVAEKQDANFVGLFVAREAALKVLPANPIFKTREPNTFDDLGGEYTLVARSPFNPSRQRKKGGTTDLDADGGWNEDLTQNNLQDDMEAFFFAAMRRKASQSFKAAYSHTFTANAGTDNATLNGHPFATGDGPVQVSNAGGALPAGLVAATNYWLIANGANTFQFATSRANALAGTKVDITDAGTGVQTVMRNNVIVAADDTFNVNDTTGFGVGALVLAKGFVNSANNGLHEVTSVTGNKIGVATALADETGAAGATLEVVGFQFDEDDLSIAVNGGTAVLSSASVDMTGFGLIPGEWAFVGGDGANAAFATVPPFYGRISAVTEETIVFDKTTSTIAGDVGNGKSIPLFFGYLVKNEDDPDLIVRYTHTVERTLGRDDDGMQSENIPGFVLNEMTWNSPLADKVNIDIGGIGMKARTRTGAEGPLSRAPGATIAKALGEDFFNTSSNVYRLRLAILDPDTLNPTPLFARVTEWNVTVNNNVSPNKSQGTLGAFDTTAGNFDVDGEFTAYFSTVAAIRSIEENADVTFDAIYAKKNGAVIMDIPLLGTGGGRLNIEQDAAIMLPLTIAAAESPFGHTALLNWLPYVPNVGMASGD